MQMVVLVLFFTISPAHAISHSRVFHMMLTKCRLNNTTQESFISTTSLSSIAMHGQRSISQTILQDQASSVSMNLSAHIAGQSSILNLRSNRISLVSAANSMCRSNFLPILKTQSKVPLNCPSRLLDIKTHSNTHAARLIMSLGLDCTWHPAIWNCE